MKGPGVRVPASASSSEECWLPFAARLFAFLKESLRMQETKARVPARLVEDETLALGTWQNYAPALRKRGGVVSASAISGLLRSDTPMPESSRSPRP